MSAAAPDGAAGAPPAVDVRPRRLRRVCRAMAAVVLAAFVGVALSLRAGDLGAGFATADQVAMALLGALIAGAVLRLSRVRVQADADGVVVRNVVGETALPWAVVLAVRLDDATPWAVLELADDDELAVLAVQASDGDLAVEAVLALRALLDRSRA